MTPERIAELRADITEARKACANLPNGYRGNLPDHIGMHYLEASQLLDAAEACRRDGIALVNLQQSVIDHCLALKAVLALLAQERTIDATERLDEAVTELERALTPSPLYLEKHG